MLSAHEIELAFNESQGLVGLWSFNETSTHLALDRSGNDLHATLSKTIRTPGVDDKALTYVQKGAHALIPRITSFPTDEITCSFWIKTKSRGAGILSYATQPLAVDWSIRDSSNLTIGRGEHFLATGESANDNQWHFIVVTWKQRRGSTALYKDGNLVYTGTLPAHLSPIEPGGALVFGQIPSGPGGAFEPKRGFEGSIDQVRIYRRALGIEEIQRIYASELGLVGLWRFDETRGSVTLDGSGNGNNAHLHGADRKEGVAGSALGFRKPGDFAIVQPVKEFPSTALTALFWVRTFDAGDGLISYASPETSNAWSVENSENLTLRIGRPAPLQTGIALNDGYGITSL